ncbi:hypothetical protein BT96DRAFT_397443 [Gymnopus androsaceus JB14]|uniref:Uncharacterized protein n=1 Tax=Gymnopus androsaceus JB14 TaxID=1447944 RepID=A0A6A4I2W3_9AGAR|nr:hypothetical protein BT96DRAFT_397443 [Gymnopus androsaceus JB14]
MFGGGSNSVFGAKPNASPQPAAANSNSTQTTSPLDRARLLHLHHLLFRSLLRRRRLPLQRRNLRHHRRLVLSVLLLLNLEERLNRHSRFHRRQLLHRHRRPLLLLKHPKLVFLSRLVRHQQVHLPSRMPLVVAVVHSRLGLRVVVVVRLVQRRVVLASPRLRYSVMVEDSDRRQRHQVVLERLEQRLEVQRRRTTATPNDYILHTQYNENLLGLFYFFFTYHLSILTHLTSCMVLISHSVHYVHTSFFFCVVVGSISIHFLQSAMIAVVLSSSPSKALL